MCVSYKGQYEAPVGRPRVELLGREDELLTIAASALHFDMPLLARPFADEVVPVILERHVPDGPTP